MAHALFAVSALLISSHTPMREKPTEDSTVVSEAYFSERITVLEELGEWTKIETAADAYRGWVKKNVYVVKEEAYSGTIAKVCRRLAHVYNREDTEFGPTYTLPFDSRLQLANPIDRETDSRWVKVSLPDGSFGFIQRGCISFSTEPLSLDAMCALARSDQFLGLEYVWGGRSGFGYDCSGFVQMLYRQMGVVLPRDSKEQIKWDGFVETTSHKLAAGDLVFFGLDGEKIRHVGLYIGEGKFVHSTTAENKPWIRISDITEPEWNGQGRYKNVTFRTLKSR